jgi:hypothetical protein
MIGSNGINWISDDCGATLRALNSGKSIQEFHFHPTERNWGLAAAWTECERNGDEPCSIVKELYYTKDLGETWTYVIDYVFDFYWAIPTNNQYS